MAQRYFCSLAALLVAAALTGCHVSALRMTAPPASDCSENQVAPQAIQPDVQPLAQAHIDPEVVPASAAEAPFSQLFEVDCQCQAARVASTADLVELESRLASALGKCQHGDAACVLQLQGDLLHLQGAEHRNTASADALRSFYRLADVEGRAAKLKQSIRIADEAILRADRLFERGLLPDVDRSSLQRQRLDLEAAQKVLNLARTQLNAELRTRLGCEPGAGLNYWPELSWAVQPQPLDRDAALAVALAQRQDIRSLRLVLGNLNMATLPVARAVLSAADPALGTAQASGNWLAELRCPDGTCDEVAVRRAQLMRLIATTQRSISAEVGSATAEVESATHEVLIAEQTVRSWHARLDELRRTRDVANGSIFDVVAVELQLLTAESQLIEKITTLRLARLKVRQAQGILAAECGLDVMML